VPRHTLMVALAIALFAVGCIVCVKAGAWTYPQGPGRPPGDSAAIQHALVGLLGLGVAMSGLATMLVALRLWGASD
jgi:hypothetical protein